LNRLNENDIPNVKQNTISNSDDKFEKINDNNDLIPKNKYKMIRINIKETSKVSPLFLLGFIALISSVVFMSKIIN